MLFAALRFYKDVNISNRVYWYLAEFPVRAGDRVFAPVGAHNRLQKAVVERTAEAEKERAPYDIALIKRVEAPCELQRFTIGNCELTDLGGVRYDDRHYTHFMRLSFCVREAPLSKEELSMLKQAGFDGFLCTEEEAPLPVCKRVLIYGTGAREYAKEIIRAAREETAELCFRVLAEMLV